MSFSTDFRDIARYERDLKVFADRALPFANRSALNTLAFETRSESQKRIDKQFILRNTFTKRSVQVDRARGLRISEQRARVGSIAEYLETQEFGGTKRKQGKHGVPIPTTVAAGQGQSAKPRTRLPTRSNKLKNISLNRQRSNRTLSRRKRIAATIREAVDTGNRFIFLDLGRTKGIFRVIGGRRNSKNRGAMVPGARLSMIHDLSEESVTIPKSPWLDPSIDRVLPNGPRIYVDALKFQLQRHRLFKP